jgi:hypothetical protein
MVVIDGIVMEPIHCAAINCTADIANARGEAFCPTHVTLFGKKCRVVGCGNRKVGDTEACALHQQDWFQHKQSRSKSTLVGIYSIKLVKVTRPGIEPRTFWTYTKCSNQLSYPAIS